MIKAKVCNGFGSRGDSLPEEIVKVIKDILPECREELRGMYYSPDYEAGLYRGQSFYDDNMVIFRLESHWEKLSKKFMDMKDKVKDALIDCMVSDYYYNYEKDWGEDL